MVCEQNLLTFNNFIVTTRSDLVHDEIDHYEDSTNYNRRVQRYVAVNPEELNNLTIHLEGKCGMDKRRHKRQEEYD